MTALWRELRSVLTVGALSAGVALAFPRAAFDFVARKVPSESEASASFVQLTAEEEDMVLKVAKTTWQDESSAMERMRVRLPLGDLPEETSSRSLEIRLPLALPEQEPVRYRPSPYRPSSSAASPVRLASEPEAKPSPVFSRDELLNLK